MTIAELLLPEVEQEMATTRRVLERVPDARLAWKPHDTSWSMGDLASHIVNMIKWTEPTNSRAGDVRAFRRHRDVKLQPSI